MHQCSSVCLSGALPFICSARPPSLSVSTSKPAASAPAPRAQAPPLRPLILTQTASGTFLLPAGPGAGTTQPILLTAQVRGCARGHWPVSTVTWMLMACFLLQGFQVPTVMTPGAPLVLNLQPNLQTVQLIQCRSARPGSHASDL